MSALPPISLRYEGEGEFKSPSRRVAALLDKELVIGEEYRMERVEERSPQSHAHYFACINNAWSNLPESMGDQFASPEHLRKYALIKAGYRDERSIACSSKAEAQRLAAFVRPMDTYAIVTVSQTLVTVYTAKSQSYRAMGKADFARSKEAVLQVLAEMIGTDPAALSQAQAA